MILAFIGVVSNDGGRLREGERDSKIIKRQTGILIDRHRDRHRHRTKEKEIETIRTEVAKN